MKHSVTEMHVPKEAQRYNCLFYHQHYFRGTLVSLSTFHLLRIEVIKHNQNQIFFTEKCEIYSQ